VNAVDTAVYKSGNEKGQSAVCHCYRRAIQYISPMPNLLLYIFPLIILIFFPAIIFLISRFGWAKLATRFRHQGSFDGTRIGTISAAVNTANYKNSIVMKYNDEGLYLKAIFIFRLFHPPLLIPWSEIGDVRALEARFGTVAQIHIGEPEIATVTVMKATFDKINRPSIGGRNTQL